MWEGKRLTALRILAFIAASIYRHPDSLFVDVPVTEEALLFSVAYRLAAPAEGALNFGGGDCWNHKDFHVQIGFQTIYLMEFRQPQIRDFF